MVASRETLQNLAPSGQLPPVTLERAIRLIDILDAFGADALIGPHIALKGATALNAFGGSLEDGRTLTKSVDPPPGRGERLSFSPYFLTAFSSDGREARSADGRLFEAIQSCVRI